MTVLATLRHLHPKRLAALGAGLAIVGLGGDVALSHFVGREMVRHAQLIPVVFAALAGGLLIVRAGAGSRDTFRWLLRGVGAAAAVVGTLGTMFHLRPFLMLLEDPGWTWDAIALAIRLAPPLMAPGAFAGIGLLLIGLASPRVSLRLAR